MQDRIELGHWGIYASSLAWVYKVPGYMSEGACIIMILIMLTFKIPTNNICDKQLIYHVKAKYSPWTKQKQVRLHSASTIGLSLESKDQLLDFPLSN